MKTIRFVATLLLIALPTASPAGGSADVVPAVNAFAVDLHHALRGEDGNLFYSPASISYALGMTRVGARGETAREMDRVLHLSGGDGDAAAYGSLMDDLLDGSDAYTLRLANRLYGQDGFGFRPEFLATVGEQFRGGFETVDFMGNAEGARHLINNWVSEQTADRIPELLPPGIPDNLTRLVLVNAIYFLGDWLIPFAAEDTHPRPFHPAGGDAVEVPMMANTASFGYAAPEGLQVLALPYKGNELEMVVLLPDHEEGLDGLAARLTAESLAGWLAAPEPTRTLVQLPKFEFTAEFGLNETLADLGMPMAFAPGAADFRGMNEGDRLHIQAVIHKAYVRVDEKGTEAAAATGVVMGIESAEPVPEARFVADRPFLFLIRHKPSGAVLFQGRVADPRS